MTQSILNLIYRWQLKLDPADVTKEALRKLLQPYITRNAQSLDKIKYRMDIKELKPRIKDL